METGYKNDRKNVSNWIPAILMQSIMSFMTVFMNMILIPFSELAVSVFSIYFKLQQFVFMAVLGMNNALIPIISYNFGAKKKERILEAIHFSLIISSIIMILGTVVFELFPKELLYLFDAKENMLSIGIPALRIISISFVFAGISIVLCSVFQALGHANQSLLITLLRQLVILIPLTWILVRNFGLDIGWISFPNNRNHLYSPKYRYVNKYKKKNDYENKLKSLRRLFSSYCSLFKKIEKKHLE